MNTINETYINALLADASYVRLQQGADDAPVGLPLKTVAEQNAAIAARLTQSQADFITSNFDVVNQELSPKGGFDAVVWRGKAGTDYAGKVYVSMRGTQGAADIADDVNLALAGIPTYQIVSMVNWWLRMTTPSNAQAKQIAWGTDPANPLQVVPGFMVAPSVAGSGSSLVGQSSIEAVNGHSLGGYLATAFTRLFGGELGYNVQSVYTFNSAGFNNLQASSIDNNYNQIAQFIGSSLGLGSFAAVAAKQTNYYGANGVNVTTNSWADFNFLMPGFNQYGQRVALYQEDSLNGNPIANHSIYKQTDLLALGVALEKLDRTMTFAKLNNAIKSGSESMVGSYEGVLDGLRRLLLGNSVAATPTSDDMTADYRSQYQANLAALTASDAFKTLVGKVTLSLASSELGTTAKTDYAAFLSLSALSPVVLSTTDATALAALQALDAQRYMVWQADKNARLYGDTSKAFDYSDNWYSDRAAMLGYVMQANAQDTTVLSVSGAQGMHYEDLGSGKQIDIGLVNGTVIKRQTLFGDAQGNTLTGKKLVDHLYGMAGDDILDGQGGNDYLEGGCGDDSYQFTGVWGKDTILDSDGQGLIKIKDQALGQIQGNGSRVWKSTLADSTVVNLQLLEDARSSTGQKLVINVEGDSSNTITIQNFDLTEAQKPDGQGYLGIKLPKTEVAVRETGAVNASGAEGKSFWSNLSASLADLAGKVSNLSEGNGKSFIVDLNQPAKAGDTLTLHLALDDSALAQAILGDRKVDANGAVITLQEGQTSVSFALVTESDISADIAGNLSVTYASGGGQTATSNSWGLNVKDAGETTRTYLGDQRAQLWGSEIQPDPVVNEDGSVTLDVIASGDSRYNSYAWSKTQWAADGTLTGGVAEAGFHDVIYGGSENDKIQGLGGNDALDGRGGNDVMNGGDGDDLITGGAGSDHILGGAGHDVILSATTMVTPLRRKSDDPADPARIEGNVIVNGGPLAMDSASDVIEAGDGDDEVYAGHGDDRIDGGNGADVLYGLGGDDVLEGGAGNDKLLGDGVTTPATYGSAAEALHGSDFMDGGDGDDTLVGGGKGDVLYGGSGDDDLYGDTSGDLLAGQYHGDDYLDGEDGSDRLWGNGGTDTLYGGAGNDKLYGDAKESELEGQFHGSDSLDGEDGDDQLIGGGGADILYGGAGNDQLQGDGRVDELGAEFHGDDYLDGEDGDDVLIGDGGADTLYGGAGNDYLLGDNAAAPSAPNHLSGESHGNDYLDGGEGNDTLAGDGGADTLLGGAGSDILYGDNTLDWLAEQYHGNDFVDGGDGDDTLYGGGGDDVLLGGKGNDLLAGEAGIDHMDGGAGDDTYLAGAGDTVVDDSNGVNTLTLVDGEPFGVTASGADLLLDYGPNGVLTLVGALTGSIRQINGMSTRDWISNRLSTEVSLATTGENQALTGGMGNDVLAADHAGGSLYGAAGDDLLLGSGNFVHMDGGVGNDVLQAGDGGSEMHGGTGEDTIYGGAGNDFLDGGANDDVLVGGGGLDTYYMSYGMGADRVIDDVLDGGMVQLSEGLGLDDLAAQRLGSDLLLQLDSVNSLRLQGYFDMPSTSWMIKDGLGNTASFSSLLVLADPSMAQDELSLVQGEELLYRNQLEAGIRFHYATLNIANYSLYQTREDGTIYAQSEAQLQGWERTGTTTQGFADVRSSTDINYFGQTSSSYSTSGISNVSWRVEGSLVEIRKTSTDATAAVVYADGYYETQVQDRADVAFRVNWGGVDYSYQSPIQSTYQFIGYITAMGVFYDESIPLSERLGARYAYTNTSYQISYFTGQTVGLPVNMDAPSGTHSLPAYVGIPYREITTTHKIQTINLDASDHTVYAGLQTIVNSSDGNDVIHGAGYAYGGAGNDTLAGGGILRGGEGDDFLRDGAWMAGGAGNDILIGGETMVAGAGHDEIYAGVGHATIEVDPTVVTNGLLGGAGDSAYFLDQYYRAQGIDNWEERRDYPGFYHLRHSDIGYGYGSREDLVREFGDLAVGGWTSFEQGLAEGWIRYLAPLPLAPLTRANDFRALEPYYEQGVLQHHAVSFGEGVSPSELQLTWGEVTGVISGTEEQLPLKYTTLNIAWGSVNQYVQVMVPHSDDPLGAGVSQFIFADGATLTMADMVAKAPPAPSFDPQIFNYQVGMGMVAVSSGYDQINFGQGISPTEITLGVGSLLLRIGDSGDVIHIDNFDPSDAMAANTIRHFNFSDGTSLSYAQLLSRGFDIYGTDANEVLTGTNLVNRIYGVGGGDTLIGSGANDTLVSGAGSDTLIGGAGHETFIVNDASDVVIARPDAASNTILSSVDYALPDNVQNLTLTGTANLTAIGNALDNVLTSNSGVNTLIGGTGNVTFVVNNSADIILANPNAASNKVLASVDYELSEGLKTLALIGNGNVTAKGNSLDNILSDNAGHYTLMAGEGNDTLIAGTGDGTLIAGDGVTTFVFNADAGHQTIIESNAVARDIMRFGEGITSSDLVFEQQGSDMRVTFSDRGSVLVRRYDLFTTDTPPYFGEWQFSDGSSISIASGSNFDEPGSFGVSKFNADGNLVAEQWAYAGGEHGRRIYGSYGSVSATHYRADGGRTIYEDDGQGNTIESEFSAGGGLLNDIWSHADGSYGSGIYAADGSSAQINHYANGGRSETTNDGYGDVMMIRYDRNGGKIASQWTKPDGSYGSDTFNPDGSGNGTANYPDGSYETYTNDDHGNVTTQFFDSDNNLLNYVVVNDDGHGNVHTSTFDAAGNLISDSWVHANSAPATTLIAAETAQQGTLYAFHIPDGSFVDPDAGDVLSYSAQLADGSTLPSWLVFDAQTQTFHGTPQNADVGAVSVAVTATDLAGESVTAIFEINVANSNDAPVVLLTLAPQAAVEQQPFAYTLPAGIFADIDVGDSLIYTLTQADGSALPAWLTFDVTTMILSGTPGVDAVGVLDLRLIAADTTGATAFQDLHIGVQALPVLQGTAGNDSLSAAPAGTLLMGMDGDDTLYGHVGGDKLYGGTGIDNLYGWNGNDILEGGDGNDLLVGDAGDDSLDGGLGDDHLFGEQGDDVLHGQEGSDYLEGNDGSDMLYGGAEIDNLVGGAGADTLDGGLGADNMVGGVGDDDYYMDNVRDWAEEGAVQGTDTVFSTVTWTLAENFENLTLAGDAAINGSGNGLANTLVGNSAVNALAGGGGADILDGRAGNDTLTGGTGSDSYLLGRGYGADTVMENDITIGDTDVAQFLMGIEASQIWFRQVGSSLEAGIIGTTDTLTIQNWYVASEYHVEQFKTADGKTLLDGQVQNLVQAMAAFTPPAAGQTTLPESYAASLTPVISANWQ